MKEILPGLYVFQMENTSPDYPVINIYMIPGGEDGRILMIDTGYRSEENSEFIKKLFAEYGFAYDKLDVFLTHKHHDHTGLARFYARHGARIFMNPEEDRHPYDCLYNNNTPEALKEQERVLRTVGVTPERSPVLFKRFMDWNREVHEETKAGMFNEIKDYTYLPITEGMEFHYGDYHLKAVRLKGHTYGQMGLYDEEKKIFFGTDQLLNGIVPIVGSTYFDDDLLDAYMDSMKEFPVRFAGYTVYPAHLDPFTNIEEVAARCYKHYEKKIAAAYKVLVEHPGKTTLIGMTTREVAFLSFGIDNEYGWESMYQTKMIITKTFSCLEYLRKHGKAKLVEAELEKDKGILFWRVAGEELN